MSHQTQFLPGTKTLDTGPAFSSMEPTAAYFPGLFWRQWKSEIEFHANKDNSFSFASLKNFFSEDITRTHSLCWQRNTTHSVLLQNLDKAATKEARICLLTTLPIGGTTPSSKEMWAAQLCLSKTSRIRNTEISYWFYTTPWSLQIESRPSFRDSIAHGHMGYSWWLVSPLLPHSPLLPALCNMKCWAPVKFYWKSRSSWQEKI